MKNAPTSQSTPEAVTGLNSVLRFWACFLLCLVLLGTLSGAMLAGFFLLMGYRIF